MSQFGQNNEYGHLCFQNNIISLSDLSKRLSFVGLACSVHDSCMLWLCCSWKQDCHAATQWDWPSECFETGEVSQQPPLLIKNMNGGVLSHHCVAQVYCVKTFSGRADKSLIYACCFRQFKSPRGSGKRAGLVIKSLSWQHWSGFPVVFLSRCSRLRHDKATQ